MASARADELEALAALISRISEAAVVTRQDADRIIESRRPNFLSANPFPQGIEAYIAAQAKAPIAMKGEDPVWGVRDHSLGYHVHIVAAQLDDWFENGHTPPPYSMRRIPLILRRLKEPSLAAVFVEARDRHFGWLFG